LHGNGNSFDGGQGVREQGQKRSSYMEPPGRREGEVAGLKTKGEKGTETEKK